LFSVPGTGASRPSRDPLIAKNAMNGAPSGEPMRPSGTDEWASYPARSTDTTHPLEDNPEQIRTKDREPLRDSIPLQWCVLGKWHFLAGNIKEPKLREGNRCSGE
jgi:hypothetical protein